MRSDVYHAYTSNTPKGCPTDLTTKQERNIFKIPEGVPDDSTTKKAMYWRNNGEVGMSSLTMWMHLLDVRHPESGKVEAKSVPYDWDDFRRCYLLLEAVPEWKEKLRVMKEVSPIWSNLIDNWDKLTSLHEQNRRREVSALIDDCHKIRKNA